jgi:hypothetical protein
MGRSLSQRFSFASCRRSKEGAAFLGEIIRAAGLARWDEDPDHPAEENPILCWPPS